MMPTLRIRIITTNETVNEIAKAGLYFQNIFARIG